MVPVHDVPAYVGYAMALWADHRLGNALVLGVAAVWAVIHQVTLMLIPGLFTTDLFSICHLRPHGAIYGLNPFISYRP